MRAGLLNLVLNAIEAAGNGGRAPLARANAEPLAGRVGDSGKGPPAAVRSTLFEPFVTSKPEGIGLGLALAQAAAQEHGGELSWSRIDGQTIFTMSLAAAGGPADDSPVVAAPNDGAGRIFEVDMSHVLIVDDEPSICWGFREL